MKEVNDIKKILGRRIQNTRLSQKMTQEELAYLIGKSAQFISEMERGIKKPNLITLIEIIKILNITPNELLIDVVQPKEEDTVSEINEIICDLNEADRRYILKFIKDYKKMVLLME